MITQRWKLSKSMHSLFIVVRKPILWHLACTTKRVCICGYAVNYMQWFFERFSLRRLLYSQSDGRLCSLSGPIFIIFALLP